MNDKIVIITGANSGIGKAATIKFSKEGYKVIMACRNIEKSKRVREDIIKLTNNENLDLMELDVSSFQSIYKFSNEFKNKYSKLDILINNAGYFKHGEKHYQLSSDNIELSYATNAIGPLYLIQLLKDWMEKSSDPRVLNACTTNIRHFFDPKRKIDFDNIEGQYISSRPYNSYKMYGDSKMSLLLLTFKLAKLYNNIKINAIQIPAIKMSKETKKKFKSIWRLLASVQNLMSNTPESMAETYYYICTTNEFCNISGKLINDKREIVTSSFYAKGFRQEIKQLFDKRVYPKYADNEHILEGNWKICTEIIEKKKIIN